MRPPVLAVAALCAVLALALSADSRPPDEAQAHDILPGRYIVVLTSAGDPATVTRGLEKRVGFEADVVYQWAVRGFAASLTPQEAATLAADPSVALVQPSGVIHAAYHDNNFQTIPTGVDRIDTELNAIAAITGTPGGGNLDIDIAVFDSGVDADHPDLNVAGGERFLYVDPPGPPPPTCGSGSFDDDHGHGTHVAGTIAAKDDDRGAVGVAPGARIWAIKVLDSTGYGEDACLIAAIDWVTDRRMEYDDGPGDGDPGVNIAVGNMSLGAEDNPAICVAITNSVAAGVMYAVAAGNASVDAALFSPANCTDAIAVAAFADWDGAPGGLADQTSPWFNCGQTEDDAFACFSNYGPTVDIAAPGVDIASTYPDDLYAWNSGTSMASPHVAGALALLKLSGYNGDADAASVMAALTTAGWTRDQASPCGFSGDPDSTDEPMLYLGTDCVVVDSDGDGVPDYEDNCLNWYNPAQGFPGPWSIPVGDSDCDGFSAADEDDIGTDPTTFCPTDPNDAWPADFDMNRVINIFDLNKLVPPVFGSTIGGGPNYSARADLDPNGVINIFDVSRIIPPVFASTCTP